MNGTAGNGAFPKKKNRFEKWMFLAGLLMIYDVLVSNASYFVALWLRFDLRFSQIPEKYLDAWQKMIPFFSAACLLIFIFCKLYRSVWKFASYIEVMRSLGGTLLSLAVMIAGTFIIGVRMPFTYYFVGAVLQFLSVMGARILYRLRTLLRDWSRNRKNKDASNVMIVGAGSAGQMILRDIRRVSTIKDDVRCFIDDDPNKWGRYIDGVPVAGGRDDIMRMVEKYGIRKIYIAIPSADAGTRRDLLNICKETGCELKNLPGMYQLVLGDVTVSAMKDVQVEDLLGREPIIPDMEEIFRFITGKTVLVTGGGGSIGSELCRQIADHAPKQLIIFDIYENNAYAVQLELKKKHPDLDLVVLIGSVRDSRRIFGVFKKYKPDIVYHAAAHKHVPLMEDSPCESIKNNAIGTYKTAYAAMVHGTGRFVLISTDKAVNPTNIMGASKRICEMIVQSFDAAIKNGTCARLPQLFTHDGEENADRDGTGEVFRRAHTEFVAVRFGNVLNSNGSVIPIFKKQIEEGGPVTVTHPDIVRYFMTIPEAVSLVLTAGTYARGGEIFVLDMGEPVKIDTLARNLIKLSGHKPDVDIKVAYTGLRPGEKLYEEKLMAEEGLQQTKNKLIFIGNPVPFDPDVFLSQLEGLMDTAYRNDEKNIRSRVKDIVSTYHPAPAYDSPKPGR